MKRTPWLVKTATLRRPDDNYNDADDADDDAAGNNYDGVYDADCDDHDGPITSFVHSSYIYRNDYETDCVDVDSDYDDDMMMIYDDEDDDDDEEWWWSYIMIHDDDDHDDDDDSTDDDDDDGSADTVMIYDGNDPIISIKDDYYMDNDDGDCDNDDDMMIIYVNNVPVTWLINYAYVDDHDYNEYADDDIHCIYIYDDNDWSHDRIHKAWMTMTRAMRVLR